MFESAQLTSHPALLYVLRNNFPCPGILMVKSSMISLRDNSNKDVNLLTLKQREVHKNSQKFPLHLKRSFPHFYLISERHEEEILSS